MTEPTPPDRRLLGVVLALAATAGFAYACLAKTWLYNPRNKALMEVGFGLVSGFECDETGECRAQTNSALVEQWARELADIKSRARENPADPAQQAFAAQAEDELRASPVFPILGWVTLACSGIAALSLLACALLAFAKRRVNGPILPTTTAILATAIGLITGCVFVALKPGPPGYVGVGLGFFAFGGAVLLGIGSALMLNKHLRPQDDDGEWA